MQDYKDFFKNKKVTVVGLGLLGKRLGDIAFLAECGAKVLVTDLKTRKELELSVKKLKKYKNITYVLGEHRFEDFDSCDFVLKGQGVALDSPYIKYAEGKGIPVEMDESLFAKLAPKVKIIGVTGTRGKSTTTILIYEILKQAGIRAHLGGNIKGTAALPLLKEVKDWDVVVFELSSWQLQGFGEAKISPHISVFTNFMPDHMNYYGSTALTTGKALERYFQDKSYIYKFQKKNDVLVLGPKMKGKVYDTKSKVVNASLKNVPKSWKIKLKGKHNMENIAVAIEVARVLKIPEKIIKKVVENFKAIFGRLEFVREVKGIKIYNDNSSTTPEATVAALRAVGNIKKRKVVLIMGGDNKFLDMSKLVDEIPTYCSKVVLFKERGTDTIRDKVFDFKKKGIDVYEEEGILDTVERAFSVAKKGETILYSPAFSSFGKYFINEYDRGEKFMKIVKNLK
ncbi:MAG TPA: UDP-N-acetylmuramoyl-L-alanine--D-glutamate ligase [Candidatus Paceibacterota bacterium]